MMSKYKHVKKLKQKFRSTDMSKNQKLKVQSSVTMSRNLKLQIRQSFITMYLSTLLPRSNTYKKILIEY